MHLQLNPGTDVVLHNAIGRCIIEQGDIDIDFIQKHSEGFDKYAKNVFVRTIKRDDVVEGLEAYIQNYKPDVLALAVHVKSFLSRIFEQSVTNHFVYHADLPMLIFRK